MPVYLDDPSILTKDKLKSELLAHNVELPTGNPTKDVYVQLYLENLTAQNKKHVTAAALDAFSSDEELPPPVVSNRSRSSGRVSFVLRVGFNHLPDIFVDYRFTCIDMWDFLPHDRLGTSLEFHKLVTVFEVSGSLAGLSRMRPNLVAGNADSAIWKSPSTSVWCGSVAAALVADCKGHPHQAAGMPPGGWPQLFHDLLWCRPE
ncbi:hypothetical protein XENOCAPTIV_005722 [Xenoophorus captivus]|uniref:LEM-like domain-containing protein n=1 Tax=Xenoophorus captivus TaxID=1517983 RepID=A0ABV0R763_9TELE